MSSISGSPRRAFSELTLQGTSSTCQNPEGSRSAQHTDTNTSSPPTAAEGTPMSLLYVRQRESGEKFRHDFFKDFEFQSKKTAESRKILESGTEEEKKMLRLRNALKTEVAKLGREFFISNEYERLNTKDDHEVKKRVIKIMMRWRDKLLEDPSKWELNEEEKKELEGMSDKLLNEPSSWGRSQEGIKKTKNTKDLDEQGKPERQENKRGPLEKMAKDFLGAYIEKNRLYIEDGGVPSFNTGIKKGGARFPADPTKLEKLGWHGQFIRSANGKIYYVPKKNDLGKPNELGKGANAVVRCAVEIEKDKEGKVTAGKGVAAKFTSMTGSIDSAINEIRMIEQFPQSELLPKTRDHAILDKDIVMFTDLLAGGEALDIAWMIEKHFLAQVVAAKKVGDEDTVDEKFRELGKAHYIMANQILKGLMVLHNDAGVAHRDYKLENSLLSLEDNTLKPVDFATASKGNSDPLQGTKPDPLQGTPGYYHPQVMFNLFEKGRGELPDAKRVMDVYAFGAMCRAMIWTDPYPSSAMLLPLDADKDQVKDYLEMAVKGLGEGKTMEDMDENRKNEFRILCHYVPFEVPFDEEKDAFDEEKGFFWKGYDGPKPEGRRLPEIVEICMRSNLDEMPSVNEIAALPFFNRPWLDEKEDNAWFTNLVLELKQAKQAESSELEQSPEAQ